MGNQLAKKKKKNIDNKPQFLKIPIRFKNCSFNMILLLLLYIHFNNLIAYLFNVNNLIFQHLSPWHIV